MISFPRQEHLLEEVSLEGTSEGSRKSPGLGS